ncbi:MAG: HAD family hydrolase [Rhodospirillaceae bacterium]|nr:HAD family hydrolase [Rhodospirillaceae bacterium]MBT5675808.1 HAD family hydrolase [Rhodospirillaceae bacterium]MBT5778587.1 HAD family hydrolase [Rhodospirillaceae bacterium]MBT6828052.1 HAD family hydrolase [Rhodospirillaceae bacterium]MBT7291415.1 HAD family hydrolase [Rhodospirillaceae bacterium]
MSDTLIIFDCDGVLVDSEPLACRILAEAVRGLGLEMDDEEANDVFIGCSIEMVLDILSERLDRPVGDDFADKFHDDLHASMRLELDPITGVHDAITKIQALDRVGGVCVASNGEPESIRTSLGAVGLLPFFGDGLFTARDAGRAKPHPGLFLHAAREMNFAPENCIVVEDSVHGVNAACAAGMLVFGYASDAQPEKLCDHRLSIAGAKIFMTMDELPALIAGA